MNGETHNGKQSGPQYTRTISPWLGLLGLLGFAGVLGFFPWYIETALAIPFPLLFFAFFGFFGFYYEGKMSHTLMDERYRLNSFRAEALANKIALSIVIVVAITSVSIFRTEGSSRIVQVLFCTIGFAFGLSIFLGQYLLYRYDCED